VFGGLNRLLAAAVVAGAILVLPPAAFADCGGKASAVNVYSECLSGGGGGKPTSSNHTSGGTQGSAGSTSAPLPQRAAKALKHAGSDGKSLNNLVHVAGTPRFLQSHPPSDTVTAVGSAFDLGSGPTALLIALAGAAFLLLGATGFRTVRHRRH